MKLYKVTCYSPDESQTEVRMTAAWTTSEGAASKIKTYLRRTDMTCEPEIVEVDVPTKRTELVEFLNKNAAPYAEHVKMEG